MFGKTRCKLCGDDVRFALKHLKDRHPDILDSEMKKMKMPHIVKKYFVD